MKKILIIAGTRPEAIKLAPLYLELKKRPGLEPIFCATAQHRGLLDQVLEVFDITPDIDLNLMQPGQTLPELTARLLMDLPTVLRDEQPACSVVQGDTTSAFAGALASYYEQIPVAHVEAGLRTGDIYAPFPEEVNRKLVSCIACWHFASTAGAAANLAKEGVPADRIFVTGNTVIDALLATAARQPAPPASAQLSDGQRMVLITAHRRESFGGGLAELYEALSSVAAAHPEVVFVYPVHPNPNVRIPAEKALGGRANVRLIEPVGYPQFVALMQRAEFIISDSGGVQEEAPALDKPVLITRTVTERPEAVENGCARLVGTNAVAIISAVEELLLRSDLYARMASSTNPFGDGTASRRIADILGKG